MSYFRFLLGFSALYLVPLYTYAETNQDPLSLANQYYAKREFKKAVHYFEEAASKNSSQAKLMLAWCYYKGEGVKKNVPKAFELYLNLASTKKISPNMKPDVAAAQLNLALFYYEGKGVSKNTKEAKTWLKKADENGDKDAKKLIKKFNL